jgi:uncharacterized protein (DUF433 family)
MECLSSKWTTSSLGARRIGYKIVPGLSGLNLMVELRLRFVVALPRRQRRPIVFDRITSNPAILGGKPIVRDTRISVEIILEWIASGATRDDVLRAHPHLTAEDVEQALGYAAAVVRNEILVAAEVSP